MGTIVRTFPNFLFACVFNKLAASFGTSEGSDAIPGTEDALASAARGRLTENIRRCEGYRLYL